MDVHLFEARHLGGIMRLAAAKGWPSLSTDRARALQALTAPGVITLVALVDGRVIGFVHALSDGVTTTYLSTIAVDAAYRGQHAGEQLLDAVFARSGVDRMDLLSEDAAEGFYQRLPHRRKPGYRLYPGGSGPIWSVAPPIAPRGGQPVVIYPGCHPEIQP